ncbi:MAG: hypothetical protein K2Q26_02330 [Bdellovibrionales bacterium]|nr:hypothetical protein [Bdellovibrionales bacterium]
MTLENYNLVPDLWRTVRAHPQADWDDALSSGQIESKMWLIHTADSILPREISCAFICAGWYGLLAALWKQRSSCPVKKFRSFDKDPSCAPIADSLHRFWVKQDWQFKAATADILSLDYSGTHYVVTKANGDQQSMFDRPDLVINTSCEHLFEFREWFDKIPKGTWVILQNNDYVEGAGHLNCVTSQENFLAQAPLSKVHFIGTLPLEKYQRFMLIGNK